MATRLQNSYKEMAGIIARFAKEEGECRTAIGNLFFARRSAPTQSSFTAQWPCFALVVQGAKSLRLGTELYRYGVGDYLVVSVDVPVVSRVTEASASVPHLGLGMAITPDRLKGAVGRANLPKTTTAASAVRAASVSTASAELLNACVRLLQLLDRPEDIPGLAPLVEQEILYRLLTGPYGAQLLQIGLADSPGNRIAKAISWLRKNFARPLRIERLSEHVGMSISSLHHHFKTATAMTPMQFQKQLRLHEARRLLLMERMDVGTAGYTVGYQSPSQFSREYRRLYGLSPQRDTANDCIA
jgi:AraC-like DNA-binding protein